MSELHNRDSPRLRFSKEELENPKLAKKAEKAEKAADRYGAAKKKLKTRRLKLTAEEVQTEQDAMQQIEADATELHEPASPSPDPSQQKKQSAKGGRSPAGAKPSGKAPISTSPATQAEAEADNASAPHARKKKLRLRFEETEAKPPSRLRHPVQRPIEAAHNQLHQQLAEANEDDNAAVSAVLQGDRLSMAITGRRIHNEVIAYQLRQSFKPGEVTPEEANQIGYELASRFLKGEHAFIVATHNDRRHVHNHIVFCATALDCTRKFRDVLRSGKALAELSDQICEEHKLSVITEPKNQTVTYDKWLGENAKASRRDMLRMTIDAALRMQPDGFDALMQLLEEAGCRIKRGTQISIKPPGAKRFIRLDTVGEEYTEETLRMCLAGKHVHIPKRSRGRMTKSQVERLIDIEAKLRSGKGKGYERWAERHNTDALASSMIYLKENHVGSYAELESGIQASLDARDALKSNIRAAQARMEEISRQKKAILVYRRTKEVYAKFRESGWSPAFYREHKADIEAHKEAQAVYGAANGKIPTLAELSEEYDLLLSQKRETGEEMSRLNEELKNLRHIKSNMDTLLDDERYESDRHRHGELNKPEQYQRTDEKLR